MRACLFEVPPKSFGEKVLRARIVVVLLGFYPAYPAHPTLKVKNLTCGMSGMSGLFLGYNKYYAREAVAQTIVGATWEIRGAV